MDVYNEAMDRFRGVGFGAGRRRIVRHALLGTQRCAHLLELRPSAMMGRRWDLLRFERFKRALSSFLRSFSG
eukprot:5648451-Alexandrium_andersonii.AAC.1